MLLKKIHDRFGFIVLETGQLLETFRYLPFGLVTLCIPDFAVVVGFFVQFLVEFRDIGIESLYSLHGLLVFLFHVLELVEETFLPANGGLILLFHLDYFPLCFDKLLVLGQLLFPELFVILDEFFHFFLEPFDDFLVLGDVFIFFGILEQFVDELFFLTQYFLGGFDLLFLLLDFGLFFLDNRLEVHDSAY